MARKHIVIKLGSSITLTEDGYLAKQRIEKLISQIKHIQKQGYTITLVVSGAVAVGRRCLEKHTEDFTFKQMAAGIGQVQLMAELQTVFLSHNLYTAQLLVTRQDLTNPKKRLDIKNMISLAGESETIVIVNENDSVALNNFGGNDYLACKIAKLLSSDYLLLLTDVEGVYNLDKTVMKEINKKSSHTIASIRSSKKVGGTGSMHAKIEAAKQAAQRKIKTYITSGHTEDVLLRLIVNKEHLGTRVLS